MGFWNKAVLDNTQGIINMFMENGYYEKIVHGFHIFLYLIIILVRKL